MKQPFITPFPKDIINLIAMMADIQVILKPTYKLRHRVHNIKYKCCECQCYKFYRSISNITVHWHNPSFGCHNPLIDICYECVGYCSPIDNPDTHPIRESTRIFLSRMGISRKDYMKKAKTNRLIRRQMLHFNY